MNSRKLIRLGNSSFAIALPKDWINKSGLKKGDSIYLDENSSGEILIRPVPLQASDEKEALIELGDKDIQTLKREITSNYIKGYTLFCFKGKRSHEINNLIKNVIGNLIGIEIIKNDPQEMIAKDLFKIEEININNFIKRMDNNLREMLSILIGGYEKGKISQVQLSDLTEADSDINKFQILISRILSIGVNNPSVLTKLKTENLTLINDWWFSFNLEHIGDEIKSVVKLIKNEPIDPKEYQKFLKFLIKLKEIYIISLESFYNENLEKKQLLHAVDEGKKIWEEFNKLTLDKNSTIAKMSMKLKEIETSIYQNLKLVLNNKI